MLSYVGLRGTVYHTKSVGFNDLQCKRRIVAYTWSSPSVTKGEKRIKPRMSNFSVTRI